MQTIQTCLTLISFWIASTFPTSIVVKIIIGFIVFFGFQFLITNLNDLTTNDWTLRKLLAGLTGGIFGLLCANLIAFPAYLLIIPSESHLAIGSALTILMGYLFAKIFIQYEPSILQASIVKTAAKNTNLIKILDSNTIIDGRIEKITEIHFVEGLIVIPEFVLDELKRIADDHDELRKQRGKQALKIATQLIDKYDYVVRYDTQPEKDVDQALVRLARNLNAKILTCDSSLIDLAASKDVLTININEISMALQMVHLRGEKLTVKIVEEGNGPGQGLAYTDDGIMVVVANGVKHLDEIVDVTITRQLQGKYGIMLFADLN